MDADDVAEEIYRAGYELERQWSVDDLSVVEELYRKAAALGSTIAMVRLGMLLEGRTRANLEDRIHYVGDYPEAARWYRMAAEQGDTFAMFHLGRLYADKLDDWGAAKPWLQKAAMADGSGSSSAREYLAAGPAGVIRRRQEAALFDQDCEWHPSNSAPPGGGCVMVIAIIGALPLLFALLTTTGRFG